MSYTIAIVILLFTPLLVVASLKVGLRGEDERPEVLR